MNLADFLLGRQEQAHRVPSERHDQFRAHRFDLFPKVEVSAGRNFVWFGIAIAGRPALDDISDEDIGPNLADRLQHFIEKFAGRPDERMAGLIFFLTGPFADEEDVAGGIAVAGNGR